jgi:hypothetical protein
LQPKSLVHKGLWRLVNPVSYRSLPKQEYEQGQCGVRSRSLEAESIENPWKLIDMNLLYAYLMRD